MLFKYSKNDETGDKGYINTTNITTVRVYGIENRIIIKYQSGDTEDMIKLNFETKQIMAEFVERLEKAME
ncbi:hypothetical protein [Acinetobacter beijerinckii]|uniref:hypothetical protein n=1 Tax=Acinetobacter beijerinckii TaxID=262668 RepID=UPI003AF7FA42